MGSRRLAWIALVLGFAPLVPLHAAQCTANTTFHWSSDVLRWGGNDVWSFGSGYIDGNYMWYWRPRVTSTSTLNGSVLLGRQNVVATASYGGEAVNQWHDAPQTTGTGIYAISNRIEYLPDSLCDSVSPINNTESLSVSRPYVTPNISGIWWLGGGADPDNGYYNQGYLTAHKGCSGSDICSETPFWTITANGQKLSLGCSVCDMNTVTSKEPSDAIGDITIVFDIGGFRSQPLGFTVNAPHRMASETPHVKDDLYQDGWWSYIFYRAFDLFNNTMSSVALNESFGAFVNDQDNNWAKPVARGLSGYSQWDFVDNMYMYNCPSCKPEIQNPPKPPIPLGNSAVDHASQAWRIGSSTVGSGVRVQNNTHQRFQDHGRHTNIVSPVN